jgi:hypothetical protein
MVMAGIKKMKIIGAKSKKASIETNGEFMSVDSPKTNKNKPMVNKNKEITNKPEIELKKALISLSIKTFMVDFCE